MLISSSAPDQFSQPHEIKFARPEDHEEYFCGNIDSSSVENEVINTSYLLLDLPPELLEPIIKRFNDPQNIDDEDLKMEFRGRSDDEVVLTTHDKTYQLRTIENSNSVMICGTLQDNSNKQDELDDRDLSLTVFKVVHETIELSDITSFPGNRLERIKELLQPHLYTGEADEVHRMTNEGSTSTDVPSSVTFSSLSEQVRASDLEIRNRLEELHVVKLKGALRMINLGYLSTILIGILKALEELGVGPHEQFAIGLLMDIITSRLNIHPVVLFQILKKFTTIEFKLNGGDDDDDDPSYSYDSIDHEHRTATLKAQEIVNQIGLSQLLCIKPTKQESLSTQAMKKVDHRYIQTMNVKSFLNIWRSKLPPSYSDFCRIEDLESHSILSPDQNDLIVIPVEKLSLEPKIRMSQLFEIQHKWRLDHIKRFLNPITGGGLQKKFDELILKFCRKIKDSKPTSNAPPSNLEKNSNHPQPSEIIWVTARNKW